MKQYLWILVTFWSSLLCAGSEKTICLNMIVKDESAVIERCLESVKGLIDYWVIVDTGSSDGTQEIIRRCLAGIPGELHERPWVDFGHNREEARLLAKGKGDYLMFVDADDKLEMHENFDKSAMDQDCYLVSIRYANRNVAHKRILFINNKQDWIWEGVLHERLRTPIEAKSVAILSEMSMITYQDGHRSGDSEKVNKDIAILKRALEKEPDNTRYMFYLAQSYANKGDTTQAMKHYEKRALMPGGWDKEVFWSIYSVARYQEFLKNPPELFVQNYCNAFHFDQSRAEPLYRLAQHFNEAKLSAVAYALSQFALTIPLPQDEMYIERDVYDFKLALEQAKAASQIGKESEARELYRQVLERKDLPEPLRKEILSILQ